MTSTQDLPHDLEQRLLQALQRRQGQATLPDLLRELGLPRRQVEPALRALLSLYRSHLDVADDGELRYRFDPAFARRQPRGSLQLALQRAARWSWRAFVVCFKIATMTLLVGYTVVFCLLIIAALIALIFVAEDAPGVDLDLGGSSGCLGSFGDMAAFWIPADVGWVDTSHNASHTPRPAPATLHHPGDLAPAYTTDLQRPRRRRKRRFYDDVFAFVFGPEQPDPPHLPEDRALLAFIRQQRGVLTLPDLILRTGLTAAEADQELTRLLVDYGGDIHVTPSGHLLATFNDLRATASTGATDAEPAPPAWHRFEPSRRLTGNTPGRNALIATLALFTLVMAVATPILIFPILNIVGTLATAALGVVPGVLALLFFLIPAVRAPLIGAENTRRRQRNLRRALLLHLTRQLAANPQAPLPLDTLPHHINDLLRDLEQAHTSSHRRTLNGFTQASTQELRDAFRALALDLNAEPTTDPQGRPAFAFTDLVQLLQLADQARERAGAHDRPFGPVVFSSDDQLPTEDTPEPLPVEVQAPSLRKT